MIFLEKINVLVVDDDNGYREELISQLKREGVEAQGAASGEEAIDLFARNLQYFQFAVIDHQLDYSNIDGIELTRRLVDLNRELFVLIYSNGLSDDPETIARYKYEALKAGAFRYSYNNIEKSPKDAQEAIIEFIAEIQRLLSLRDWMGRYHQERENIPTLNAQLETGINILDQSYKLWFMNDDMRRINGMSPSDLFKPCVSSHNFKSIPCPGCLAKEVFETGQTKEHIVLLPFPHRKEGKLFYIFVSVQPVKDEKGESLSGKDGKPLAIIELTQDLTDSSQLKEMSLEERLTIIANSLYNLPKNDCYRSKRWIERVRIMVYDSIKKEYIIKSTAGYTPLLKYNTPINFPEHFLQILIETLEDGFFLAENTIIDLPSNTPNKNYIYWPVLGNNDDNEILAILEISGEDCSEDIQYSLKPYINEIFNTIHDNQDGINSNLGNIKKILLSIDLELNNIGTPEEALSYLLDKVTHLTGSYGGHIRYREENEAVILRYEGMKLSPYAEIAKPRLSLSNQNSRSVRTILSGKAIILNETKDGNLYLGYDPEIVKKVLGKVKAVCLEPLQYNGIYIGSLCLHALEPSTFTEDKVYIAQEIARRISLALHDYLVGLKIKQQVETAQIETFGLILHNLSTPITTIRTAIDRLKLHLDSGKIDKGFITERINVIQRQIQTVASIRGQFLKLYKPHQSRMEDIYLHEFIKEIISNFEDELQEIKVDCILDPNINFIKTDKIAIELCLGVLLQNSLDALQEQNSQKKINISLRSCLPNERKYFSSSETGLAIDVMDNGPGIPNDIIEKLFHIIKSSKATGLGFGLNACKRTINSAQGDIYFHKEFNNGTKFTFILPYQQI